MKNRIWAAVVASIASLSMAQVPSYTNTGLWFDGTDSFVKLGDNCAESNETCEKHYGGYWYNTDDRKDDHGGSYVTYPYDTTGYNGSLIAPQIEKLHYVTVRYHLMEPSLTGQREEYPYNFVTFGFNTSNEAMVPLDISATGGLCVTYTSDFPVALEIKDSISGMGRVSCSAKLSQTSTPETAESAIKDFAQPTWTPDENKLANCDEAFKIAQAIWFRIEGNASEHEGQLRIFEVGPLGTCKGGRTIAEEQWPNCKTDKIPTKPATAKHLSINGRTVSLNILGGSVHYRLFDMQGNTVEKGYATEAIDLSGVKSGNYVLKVNGTVKLTQKILLK